MIAEITPGLVQRLGQDEPAIETRGLAKRFRKTTALDGLDLSVPREAVYVLVGPNGAGKTTTLRILMDLVRPDTGSAEVLGLTADREGPETRARIGYVPESRHEGCIAMTVGRLLDFHRAYYPTWDDAYAASLLGALDVDRDAVYGALSKGQGRRVQLVQALAHRPPLLLLDEPTDALDPLARDRVLGLLSDHLAETPTTVVISTHHVQEVQGLADSIGVLRRGRLVAQLTTAELHDRLRRYRATVPEDWSGAPQLEGRVLQRQAGAREIAWVVWGDPDTVTGSLATSGAEVRHTEALSLEEAARTLLAMEEQP